MDAPKTPIHHILVPHDFSETAGHALDLAISLAAALGARLTIVHAYEVVSYAYAEGLNLAAETVSEIDRLSRIGLEKLAARARERGVDVSVALRQGHPWRQIVEVAKESKADMIVMGTRGRTGVARMLMGSVAERVVRTAPCPVLTVHGSECEH